MPQKIKILCTLGPASLNEKVISRLANLNVDVFRLNLSHLPLNEVENTIKLIQGYVDVPICLDSEGAQIRTGRIANNKVDLNEGEIIEITDTEAFGNAHRISLTPSFVVKKLKPGDLISVDFESALLKIIKNDKNSIMAQVISSGTVGSNKAVNVDRAIDLPVVSEKDKAAIKIGRKYGLKHFALSFAGGKNDVKLFRQFTGKAAHIISKIESKKGIDNLEDILDASDSILIDRGDLSREEPIEKIPFMQKIIIRKAKAKQVPVYVATNLLESMVKSKKPTRAEANDVVNTLADGADGLVLAAETAIGRYPIDCVMMITKIIKQFLNFSHKTSFESLGRRAFPLLPEPHGGVLINRVNYNLNPDSIKRLKVLEVGITTLLDAEQIALGTFSPLEGFMGKRDLESVLDNYRLSNGLVWPIPVVLQVNKAAALGLKNAKEVALSLSGSKEIYAVLHLEDIYTYSLDKIARGMFGTSDSNHPGVGLLKEQENYFLSGKITLIKRIPSQFKHYEITPLQARTIFENKGWSRVVGFHSRNVIHRVHEHIQKLAFKKYHCDGLFLHPVVGPKKPGDYVTEVILKSYEIMMRKYYPKGEVYLAAFQNYSRYAGPREAVFTALCRKNFGCSHFIIGRDHTGVGNYYKSDDAHKLFKYLGNIGIEPIFFNAMHYCKRCKKYIEYCHHDKEHILNISGSHARKIFKSNKKPPEWFMRREISELVLSEIEGGREVFIR